MTTRTKGREQVGLAATGGAIAYYARLGAMTSAGKHGNAGNLEIGFKRLDELLASKASA
jgi:hypothetical protein